MPHNRDLIFLSREFETLEIPKDKKYMVKYFKTPVQLAFLRYFLSFGEYSSFEDHTGIPCRMFWLNELHQRFLKLESLREDARKNFDMTLLAKIESGKYKI